MSPSYIFKERSQLDTAVYAWIDDQDSVTATYGDINTWDVSEITDFKSLRIKDVGRHSKIYNGSKDLLAIIYNEDNLRKSVDDNYLI